MSKNAFDSLISDFQLPRSTQVLLNFLYELRGLNGSHPNITGGRLPPTPKPQPSSQWGACTSTVVGTPSDGVYHQRNLDWNLPGPMRNMTFECHWHRAGVEVARGACFAGKKFYSVLYYVHFKVFVFFLSDLLL